MLTSKIITTLFWSICFLLIEISRGYDCFITGFVPKLILVFSFLGSYTLVAFSLDESLFLLGSEFFCGSYCASRLLPGAPGQEMHLDYPYWDFYKSETFPLGLNSSFPQNCQVTIPLDECSALSGATGYIPGSQKKLHYPNANDDFSNKQQMIGSPGDIIFFNGNCCHGAMTYKSQNQRSAILIEFLPKYIKPVEDLVSYLDESFKKNSNDRIKQLLGLQYPYPKIMDVSKSVNDIGIGYKAKN
mgnify:CR=1 FL=1